ncbi:MAG: hypothetical protein HY725_14270 [Candidatus Rokubacteria bacterium]|nr:hypothetical protein [Candidatus Rokubacteria bacterium]
MWCIPFGAAVGFLLGDGEGALWGALLGIVPAVSVLVSGELTRYLTVILIAAGIGFPIGGIGGAVWGGLGGLAITLVLSKGWMISLWMVSFATVAFFFAGLTGAAWGIVLGFVLPWFLLAFQR